MHINYLNLFSAQVSGDQGTAHQFIRDEFHNCISDRPLNDLTIRVRFEKDSMTTGDYIVREPVTYDEKGVYIFDQDRRKARIDFDAIGNDLCTVECDPDFYPPFFAILFEYIAYIEALRQKRFVCHASGFVYQGKVILCPAWRNVGKTNTLLNFMYDGASYLADDWCLLNENGSAYRVPKRIHLFDYNFISFPGLVDVVAPSFGPLAELYTKLVRGEYDIQEKIVSEIRQKLRMRVEPAQLFPSQVVDSAEKLYYVFLLTRNVNDPERGVYLQPLDRDTLVLKLVEILGFEQRPFRLAYAIHKARTGRVNALLEEENYILRVLAENAFSKVRLFELFTPGQEHASAVKTIIQEVIERGNHDH